MLRQLTCQRKAGQSNAFSKGSDPDAKSTGHDSNAFSKGSDRRKIDRHDYSNDVLKRTQIFAALLG